MTKAANAKTNGHTVPELKTAARKAAPKKPAAKAAPAKTVAAKTAPANPAAARPAVKAPATPAAKPAPKPAAKKAPAVKAPAAAKSVAVKPAAPAAEKARKPKLVRDSFTMPELEYAVLGQVKKACIKAGFEIKKSELLRIGVALISQLDLATLKNVLGSLPQLKTGRPKND